MAKLAILTWAVVKECLLKEEEPSPLSPLYKNPNQKTSQGTSHRCSKIEQAEGHIPHFSRRESNPYNRNNIWHRKSGTYSATSPGYGKSDDTSRTEAVDE